MFSLFVSKYLGTIEMEGVIEMIEIGLIEKETIIIRIDLPGADPDLEADQDLGLYYFMS